jgi:hypothetical protein
MMKISVAPKAPTTVRFGELEDGDVFEAVDRRLYLKVRSTVDTSRPSMINAVDLQSHCLARFDDHVQCEPQDALLEVAPKSAVKAKKRRCEDEEEF